MALFCAHQGKGNNGQLWYDVLPQAGQNWQGDKPVRNAGSDRSPSLASFGRRLFCARNVNDAVYVDVYTAQKGWTGDLQIVGAHIAESPALGVIDDQLFCFYQALGDDDRYTGLLYYSIYDDLENRWLPPANAFGDSTKPVMSVSPALCQFSGKYYCFFQAPGRPWLEPTGDLYYSTSSNGTSWTAPTQVVPSGSNQEQVRMSYAPSPLVSGSTLYCFMQGWRGSNELWYTWTSDGTSWAGNTHVVPSDEKEKISMCESPSAILFGGSIYVFHQGIDDDRREDGMLWYTTSADGTWAKDSLVTGVGLSGSPATAVF